MYADLDELGAITEILKKDFDEAVEVERKKVRRLNEVVKHSNANYDIDNTVFELNNVLIPIVYNNLTAVIEKCLNEWAFILGVNIKLEDIRSSGPYRQLKFLKILTLINQDSKIKTFYLYKDWNKIRNIIVHERSQFYHIDYKLLNKKGIEKKNRILRVTEKSLLLMIDEIESYFNEFHKIIYDKTLD